MRHMGGGNGDPQVQVMLRRAGIQCAPRSARRLAKGFGHENWLVETDEDSLLLKLAVRVGFDKLRSAKWYSDTARDCGVPTPRIIHVDDGVGLTTPRPFMIQEFLPGVDAEDALQSLSIDAEHRLWRQLGMSLAMLHSVDGGDAEMWVERQRRRLAADAAAHREKMYLTDETVNRVEVGLLRLLDQAAPTLETRLTHRDVYPPNLLTNGGDLVALLDFDHAKFADPLTDFAKIAIYILTPDLRRAAPLVDGYLAGASALPPALDERITFALGNELFHGILYFLEWGPTDMATSYAEALDRWPEHPATEAIMRRVPA